MEKDKLNVCYYLPPNDSLLDESFFFIGFEYMVCKDEVEYLPLEVGLVEWSMKCGIIKADHTFINPGPIPLGYRFQAQVHSEETHMIPPEKFGEGTKNYAELWQGIEEFLVNGAAASRISPVFCREKTVKKVKGCIDWLYDHARVSYPNPIVILLVEDLFFELTSRARRSMSRAAIIELLSTCVYDFEDSTNCSFHLERKSEHCALGCPKHYTFVMSEALSPMFNFELTNCHLPFEKKKSAKGQKEFNCFANKYVRPKKASNPQAAGNSGLANNSVFLKEKHTVKLMPDSSEFLQKRSAQPFYDASVNSQRTSPEKIKYNSSTDKQSASNAYHRPRDVETTTARNSNCVYETTSKEFDDSSIAFHEKTRQNTNPFITSSMQTKNSKPPTYAKTEPNTQTLTCAQSSTYAHTSISVQPATCAQPSAYSQPSTCAQPFMVAQSSTYAQPSTYAQFLPYAQLSTYAQPSAFVQSSTYAQPSIYAQFSTLAQPSAYAQTSTYDQPSTYASTGSQLKENESGDPKLNAYNTKSIGSSATRRSLPETDSTAASFAQSEDKKKRGYTTDCTATELGRRAEMSLNQTNQEQFNLLLHPTSFRPLKIDVRDESLPPIKSIPRTSMSDPTRCPLLTTTHQPSFENPFDKGSSEEGEAVKPLIGIEKNKPESFVPVTQLESATNSEAPAKETSGQTQIKTNVRQWFDDLFCDPASEVKIVQPECLQSAGLISDKQLTISSSDPARRSHFSPPLKESSKPEGVHSHFGKQISPKFPNEFHRSAHLTPESYLKNIGTTSDSNPGKLGKMLPKSPKNSNAGSIQANPIILSTPSRRISSHSSSSVEKKEIRSGGSGVNSDGPAERPMLSRREIMNMIAQQHMAQQTLSAPGTDQLNRLDEKLQSVGLASNVQPSEPTGIVPEIPCSNEMSQMVVPSYISPTVFLQNSPCAKTIQLTPEVLSANLAEKANKSLDDLEDDSFEYDSADDAEENPAQVPPEKKINSSPSGFGRGCKIILESGKDEMAPGLRPSSFSCE